mmetsp:Transcript_10172/g.17751  ORF Transcript_10172/g.17751 Transcript_10172/m.17751 type:complete len:215 (-) Transcript_10172:354-998(-)
MPVVLAPHLGVPRGPLLCLCQCAHTLCPTFAPSAMLPAPCLCLRLPALSLGLAPIWASRVDAVPLLFRNLCKCTHRLCSTLAPSGWLPALCLCCMPLAPRTGAYLGGANGRYSAPVPQTSANSPISCAPLSRLLVVACKVPALSALYPLAWRPSGWPTWAPLCSFFAYLGNCPQTLCPTLAPSARLPAQCRHSLPRAPGPGAHLGSPRGPALLA